MIVINRIVLLLYGQTHHSVKWGNKMNSSSGCSTVPTITMLCKKRLRVQGHVQVGKPPVEALLPHFDENKSSFRFLLDIVSRFKMVILLHLDFVCYYWLVGSGSAIV